MLTSKEQLNPQERNKKNAKGKALLSTRTRVVHTLRWIPRTDK